MGKRLVLFLSFSLVFGLGFVAGTLWRSTTVVPSTATSGDLSTETNDDLWSQFPFTEAQIAQALEDPDFKRVHDYLNREQPVQLNVPNIREETPPEQIPMEERPPVHFTLE